jgi:hypothetical protein
MFFTQWGLSVVGGNPSHALGAKKGYSVNAFEKQ